MPAKYPASVRLCSLCLVAHQQLRYHFYAAQFTFLQWRYFLLHLMSFIVSKDAHVPFAVNSFLQFSLFSLLIEAETQRPASDRPDMSYRLRHIR